MLDQSKKTNIKNESMKQPPDNCNNLNLTRRGRTRYRAALAQGLSPEKALLAAEAPVKVVPVKRLQSKKAKKAKKANKESKANKTKTETKLQPAQINHVPQNPTTGEIQLGFIATNKSPPLSAEHMTLLQDAILEVTVAHSTANVLPQFDGCWPRGEWLELVCANRSTAKWIRANFVHIRERCGLDIELLEAHQIPRHLIDGYFPNSVQLPDEKVLAFINAQNPVNTKQWRILRRTVNGPLLHLSLAIDDVSMRTLIACAGEICYCFGKLCLNLNRSATLGNDASLASVPASQVSCESQSKQLSPITRNHVNSLLEQLDFAIDSNNNAWTSNAEWNNWNHSVTSHITNTP